VGSKYVSHPIPCFLRRCRSSDLPEDLLAHKGEDEPKDLLIDGEPLVVGRI
jgi:hypothetical protein